MAPAWMLSIERIKNTDAIMAPAWMLFIERLRTRMLLWLRRAYGLAMNAEGFTPCVVAAAFFSPRRVPKCCSCHAGQSRWAWAGTHFFARLQAVGAFNKENPKTAKKNDCPGSSSPKKVALFLGKPHLRTEELHGCRQHYKGMYEDHSPLTPGNLVGGSMILSVRRVCQVLQPKS